MKIGHWWSDKDRGTPNFGIIMTGKINVLGGGGGTCPIATFSTINPKLSSLRLFGGETSNHLRHGSDKL
jgi:hypothetical protein